MKWAEKLIAVCGLKGGGLFRMFWQISGSGIFNLAFLSSDIFKVGRKWKGIKATPREKKFLVVFFFSFH